MGNNPALVGKLSQNQFDPNSVVVITGASSGMGKELALRYASRHCKVVIAARRLQELNQIKQTCLEIYGNSNVLAVETDVSKEADS